MIDSYLCIMESLRGKERRGGLTSHVLSIRRSSLLTQAGSITDQGSCCLSDDWLV